MNKSYYVISVATVYLVLYTLLAILDNTEWVVILMFSLSPIVVIYMVYKVLRDEFTQDKKFSEGYWYGDLDRVAQPEK
mgnify:CR=1